MKNDFCSELHDSDDLAPIEFDDLAGLIDCGGPHKPSTMGSGGGIVCWC